MQVKLSRVLKKCEENVPKQQGAAAMWLKTSTKIKETIKRSEQMREYE